VESLTLCKLTFQPNPAAVAVVVVKVVVLEETPGKASLKKEYSRKPRNLLIISMAS
jgi:hypothetical protein